MRKIEPDSSLFQRDLFSLDTTSAFLHEPALWGNATPPPPQEKAPSLTAKKRHIELDGKNIPYEFRRSKRRSIGFLVNKNGLRVTAPQWTTIQSIEDAIRVKERWITGKLDYFLRNNEKEQAAPFLLKNGIKLPYLGRDLLLHMQIGKTDAVLMNEKSDELIVVVADPACMPLIKENLKHWFQEQAKQVFSQRMPIYAKALNVTYSAFALSSARHRWGSCSIARHIRLNWRLIHFPLTLIDYVIAHELAHIRQMNHSKHFWEVVSTVYPDYKNARKQLHQQGSDMLSLF